MQYKDNIRYLKHHGVLGMKWGVRRDKNKRRTETKEEKEQRDNRFVKNATFARQSTDIGMNVAREGKNIADTYYNYKKRNVKRMNLDAYTDDELRRMIEREIIEKKFEETFNPQSKQIDMYRDNAKSYLDAATSALALAGSAVSIAVAVKQLKSSS